MVACDELELIEGFLDAEDCGRFLDYFLHRHEWPDNRYAFAGRQFVLPRLQTWHADAGIRYSYSNNLLVTRPWTDTLSAIRRKVENRLAYRFNSVLVNHYRNGDDFVGWHADNEPELGESPLIASLSLGAVRPLAFQRKSNMEAGQLLLPSGSLLLMRPPFQSHWQHSVPRDQRIGTARINLTFRNVCRALAAPVQ